MHCTRRSEPPTTGVTQIDLILLDNVTVVGIRLVMDYGLETT
jgi:hypothetical protein